MARERKHHAQMKMDTPTDRIWQMLADSKIGRSVDQTIVIA